jgi:hypothetical protein
MGGQNRAWQEQGRPDAVGRGLGPPGARPLSVMDVALGHLRAGRRSQALPQARLHPGLLNRPNTHCNLATRRCILVPAGFTG